MRVKKIELIGFKSFGDRTEIELGQGVTCIVGPNGCGKSNVSDAIRWVFGERSAKLLRGTRMEDVIFNGTELRKPMGVAEVSLVIDNQDHRLPLAYEEVVLTRRLDRSGQSQYFINRTPCRLKDILDLILDTGMGSNSYSMIEQGRVDFIINADPEERRSLIEEAAGISKYKVKKEEALRKLQHTEENLLRIRDILSEVQRNIQYAERQAKRAERYRLQWEELKRLEIHKAFLELDEIKIQKNIQEGEKTTLTTRLEDLETRLRHLLQKEEEQRNLLQKIIEEESTRTGESYQLRSEMESMTQRRAFDRERRDELSQRKAEINKELDLLRSRLLTLEQELDTKQKQNTSLSGEHLRIETDFAEHKARFDEEEVLWHQTKEEAEGLVSAIFENAAQLSHAKNELQRLRVLNERSQLEEQKIGEALIKLLRERETFEGRKLSYEEELSSLTHDWRQAEASREASLSQLRELKRETAQKEKEVTARKLRLQEVHSRLQLLEELDEAAEEAERKLLATAASPRLQGKLVRSLREVLRIQTGYESAAEAILGAFAQGLVAEDVQTARGLVEEMTQAHLGPCGIFIQSLVRPNGKHGPSPTPTHPKIQKALQQVVTIQQGFEALFEPLFTNVFVVEDFFPEDLEALLPLAEDVRLVTKQGILLGPQARIFFRNGRLSPQQGPFQRQSEIRSLREKVTNLQQELDVLAKEELAASTQVNHLEKEIGSGDDKRQDDLVRKQALESLLRGLEDRLEVITEETRVLEYERTELAEGKDKLPAEIQAIETKVQELAIHETALIQRQKETGSRLQQIQLQREESIQRLSRLKTLLENHEEKRQGSLAAQDLMLDQIRSHRERIERLEEEDRQTQIRITGLQKEEDELNAREREIEVRRSDVEGVLSEIRGRRAFQDEKHRELRTERDGSERELATLKETLHQQELSWMELVYRERTVVERMDQSYHVKLDELKSEGLVPQGLAREEIEDKIRSLKERVESFGPVNLLAEEEYQELKQRQDFLAAQEKDLNDARESLLEAIRKINRTTKTLFAETFARAQTLFQEYYQVLFNGGHAELLLVEAEESEEAGIEVMARPPGKKLQHISLLSGGEKALTGIALLFALFRIKPSPLCVLDEVDAPLDEANIDRFLNVLRTFLDSTQFLIITHNRKTIAMGDYLYGVTMEESGVSKLVSVKVSAPEPGMVAAS